MMHLASPGDRAGIECLAQQVHELHVQWRPDLYESVPELYSEERFQEAIGSRRLYAAKIEDTIIGYCLLSIRTVEGAGVVRRIVMRVEEFCVEETLRGQGFGQDMMEDVRALAAAFRCTDLQLGVYPQNDDAVGFFQKCGFTIRSIEMQRKV